MKDIHSFKKIGVVLAGGRSTRMGKDKATLILRGETLLTRSLKVVEQMGCDALIVSGRPEESHGARSVQDEVSEQGPVGGLVSAIEACKDHLEEGALIIVLAVDTPCMSAEFLEVMVDCIGRGAHAYGGCVVSGSPLPLVLVNNVALRQRCVAFREHTAVDVNDTWSVRYFVAPLGLAVHPMNALAKHALVNVNTPEEWQALNQI